MFVTKGLLKWAVICLVAQGLTVSGYNYTSRHRSNSNSHHLIAAPKRAATPCPAAPAPSPTTFFSPHQPVNQNSPCDPYLTHCCFHRCPLCHEHREMKG